MTNQITLEALDLRFFIEGETDPFTADFTSESHGEGKAELILTLTCDRPEEPPKVRVAWKFRAVDTLSLWHTGRWASHHLPPDWSQKRSPLRSSACNQAPVFCLHSLSGKNSLTAACDDALHPVALRAGLIEETGEFDCSISPFEDTRAAAETFTVRILVDTRPVPYYTALKETADWWASHEGYEPCPVPDAGKRPMYSTWYSFHQNVESGAIEKQCTLAGELGCEAVIIDDGWQTTNSERGYAYTGDWKPERMADIKEHVQRVHDMGMKVLLWYSVPYVGVHSKAWECFKGKLLHTKDWTHNTLDPRYPEVREYLIGIYEDAVRNWDLDGLKLDFVDSFNFRGEERDDKDPGMDMECVYEAADRLLRETMDRLRAIKYDIMIEFRQTYIGPLMKRYGNLFRAGDCPLDAEGNRIRTLDIRLLCGDTAAHSDMIMWHPDDLVENAALQFVNIIFSVPQISVRLDRIPEDHKAMLRFWLSFWNEHRDTLLGGELKPLHPELLYTQVSAVSDRKIIAAAYGDGMVQIPGNAPGTWYIVNGTRRPGVVIDTTAEREAGFVIRDCTGVETEEGTITVSGEPFKLDIPPAGVAELTT